MARAKGRATYDDLLALPDHVVGEIIGGELIATPRPASPHAVAGTAIGSDLFGSYNRPPGGGTGGWWILFEPELHLGADVLVPDVAGWRRERMPRIPNVPAFELAPDWVCEIVSPSTERIDRARKMAIYAQVRVEHLWLVNPLIRTLEIYRLEGEGWKLVTIFAGSEKIRAVPFDAIELELDRWWIEPEPAAP
ncbi:MAG: Uma2 family endonuclease [Polyangia bacterium]|jgi:Uma2 family endonuclease